MKNLIYFLYFTTSLLLASCGAGAGVEEPLSQGHLSELIQSLEGTLQEQKDQERTDSATVRTLAERAEEYARRFPQDTLSSRFLFQAAAASRGIGDFQKAVELWGKAAADYENHSKAPEALFLLAFTLDENMKDTARAREQYEAFLERYPKHPLANDTRVLLEAIKSGKSADDLVEEFKQQPLE